MLPSPTSTSDVVGDEVHSPNTVITRRVVDIGDNRFERDHLLTPSATPTMDRQTSSTMLSPTTTLKRSGHSSSVALDRFLHDPRRRTCSFVNLASDALEELVETAYHNRLVLTQKEELNVGSVVRLTWPSKEDAPAEPADPTHAAGDDPTWCPRCEVPNFAGGMCGRISLCSKCSSSSSRLVHQPHHLQTSGLAKGASRLTLECPPRPQSPVLPTPPKTPLATPTRARLPYNASFATQRLANDVLDAVAETHARPELTTDGTGGVYLIRRISKDGDAHGPAVGIFKPCDEAAGCENNPRGLSGHEHAMREGFPAGGGGGATRERVAYQLDKGFAGVPPTAVQTLLLRTHTGTRLSKQSGSVQAFVPSEGDASDYRFDGSDFDEGVCQRVALMDCRLFNTDRHEGNLLVRTKRAPAAPTAASALSATPRVAEEDGDVIDHTPLTSEILLAATAAVKAAATASDTCMYRDSPVESAGGGAAASIPLEAPTRKGFGLVALQPKLSPLDDTHEPVAKLEVVPIDHAFILPRFGYFREAEFAWRYWGAAQKPFGPDAVEYIAALDVDADVEVARQAGLDESSCATLRVCTMLLRAALLGGGTRCANDGDHADSNEGSLEAPASGTPAGVAPPTPRELASMLMREAIDVPSPLERMCARALGIEDEEQLTSDTALIDLVVHLAEAQSTDASEVPREPPTAPGPASFVPPPEFYVRFATLLQENYGMISP